MTRAEETNVMKFDRRAALVALAVLLASAEAASAEPPPAVDLTPIPPLAQAAADPATPPPASPAIGKPAAAPPYFPLWGEKARAAGFELPAAWGLMVNYYYQRSSIEIANLKLGVNGGTMHDASFIQFGDSVARAQSVGLRPNLLLFPFLSVYAVLNGGTSSTEIGIASPVSFTSVADSTAVVVALGATFQMGYKGFFGVADFNGAVADVDRIADLMGSNLLSFRVGYNYRFKTPERSLGAWVGTAGQVIDVNTRGSVKLAEVIPAPSQEQAAAFQQRCDGLSNLNPARQACNQLASSLTNWANGTPPTTTVDYSLEKKPKDVWNMIAGAQFALDRNWMFRCEAGFLSSRTSLMLATEYRWDGF
jgi:hypothetical protein